VYNIFCNTLPRASGKCCNSQAIFHSSKDVKFPIFSRFGVCQQRYDQYWKFHVIMVLKILNEKYKWYLHENKPILLFFDSAHKLLPSQISEKGRLKQLMGSAPFYDTVGKDQGREPLTVFESIFHRLLRRNILFFSSIWINWKLLAIFVPVLVTCPKTFPKRIPNISWDCSFEELLFNNCKCRCCFVLDWKKVWLWGWGKVDRWPRYQFVRHMAWPCIALLPEMPIFCSGATTYVSKTRQHARLLG
jgi:hypothetical protein